MCECCTPKENLGHLQITSLGEKSLDALNDVVRRIPGVFRALDDNGSEAAAVVLFDNRIVDDEILRNAVTQQGFQV
jgi:hypothetical protein